MHIFCGNLVHTRRRIEFMDVFTLDTTAKEWNNFLDSLPYLPLSIESILEIGWVLSVYSLALPLDTILVRAGLGALKIPALTSSSSWKSICIGVCITILKFFGILIFFVSLTSGDACRVTLAESELQVELSHGNKESLMLERLVGLDNLLGFPQEAIYQPIVFHRGRIVHLLHPGAWKQRPYCQSNTRSVPTLNSWMAWKSQRTELRGIHSNPPYPTLSYSLWT